MLVFFLTAASFWRSLQSNSAIAPGNVHEFAGVADVVAVCTGYSEDVIPHLKTTLGAHDAPLTADAVFFDQRGTRFHTDLQMLEGEGLLKDGCAVLADNVLKPGAPHFLWYLSSGFSMLLFPLLFLIVLSFWLLVLPSTIW